MKRANRHVGKGCNLFEVFTRLLREKDDYVDAAGHNRARAVLQQWMEEAKESGIQELKRRL